MNDEERQALLERLTEIKAELERLKAKKAEEEERKPRVKVMDILFWAGIIVPSISLLVACICLLFAEPSETPEICRMLSSTNTSVWVKDSRYKEIPGPAIIVVKDTDKAKDKADASDIK